MDKEFKIWRTIFRYPEAVFNFDGNMERNLTIFILTIYIFIYFIILKFVINEFKN